MHTPVGKRAPGYPSPLFLGRRRPSGTVQRQQRAMSAADIKSIVRRETSKSQKNIKRPKLPNEVDRSMGLQLSDFCQNTSIHGLKYVGERRRPLIERGCWAVSFTLCLAACCFLIGNTWRKWDSSPVIVSFDTTLRPLWTLPFPAVTICPMTKARRSLFDFSEVHQRYLEGNITDEELKKMSAVSLMCDTHVFNEGNATTDDSTVTLLEELAPTMNDVLVVSKWKQRIVSNMSSLFQPLLTEEGLCFSFNMLNASRLFANNTFHDEHGYLNYGQDSRDWTLDTGYSDDADVDTYPNRALGAGQDAGISVVLQLSTKDLEYKCKGPVQGFKIHLHNPAEFPQVGQQYFRLPLNQEVVVAVTPDVMTTSDGLRGYAPHRRQCYFPYERKLRFFQVYTQQNCAFECLTNHTLRKCGCVALHMPRSPGTPICSSGSISCMQNASGELLVSAVRNGLKPGGRGLDCDCIQSCTMLKYHSERSQADFDWMPLFVANRDNVSLFENVNMARVYIFFKDSQFIPSHRNELYGPTDFLANCGGLLGLCMGISALSLVELLYWVALTLFCSARGLHREVSQRTERTGAKVFTISN